MSLLSEQSAKYLQWWVILMIPWDNHDVILSDVMLCYVRQDRFPVGWTPRRRKKARRGSSSASLPLLCPDDWWLHTQPVFAFFTPLYALIWGGDIYGFAEHLKLKTLSSLNGPIQIMDADVKEIKNSHFSIFSECLGLYELHCLCLVSFNYTYY